MSASPSPVRLNHAVLFVADVDASTRFYTEVFGMELVMREAQLGAVFLRLPRSGNHHDLGLFAIGLWDESPAAGFMAAGLLVTGLGLLPPDSAIRLA
jgi:catechol 2,3-dioxygenase-like lactoylglutathione lyase family enzyme